MFENAKEDEKYYLIGVISNRDETTEYFVNLEFTSYMKANTASTMLEKVFARRNVLLTILEK